MKPLSKIVLSLSAESLRWALGLYCTFVGAFMLVAPHRFGAPVYGALTPYRSLWGTAALAAGVALLAVAILRPRRVFALLGHLLAGITLLALAASFQQNQAWTGMIAYGVLGIGTLAAGLMPRNPGRDLFALLMGLIGILQGLLLVGPPGLLGSSYFDVLQSYLRPLGLALLLGAVCWSRRSSAATLPPGICGSPTWSGERSSSSWARPSPCRAGPGPVSPCTGAAVWPWPCCRGSPSGSRRSTPRPCAPGWLSPWPTATSVAIVITAAVATSQEERLARAQVMETRRVEAQSIARNVADYVLLNGARAAVVATLAGGLPMDPVVQRALLEASRPSYPDVAGFVTLDAAGTVLAVHGRGAARPERLAPRGLGPAEPGEQRHPHPPGRAGPAAAPPQRADPQEGWADVGRPGQRLRGGAAGAPALPAGLQRLPRGRLRADHRQQRAERRVGEAAGRLGRGFPARPDADPGAPDRRLRRVPGLSWVVAVERPGSAALAGVRKGRDLAFALLLLVVPLAVIGGIIVARRIARPLGTLAKAVGELTAGNPVELGTPLESSDITEVEGLAAAFREMRGRLAVRTRESERLAGELRARADALRRDRPPQGRVPGHARPRAAQPAGRRSPTPPTCWSSSARRQPPVQRDARGIIQRQVQHLVRLVDDLLDVSRITRGKIELRQGAVDLRDAVAAARWR